MGTKVNLFLPTNTPKYQFTASPTARRTPKSFFDFDSDSDPDYMKYVSHKHAGQGFGVHAEVRKQRIVDKQLFPTLCA